MVEVAQEPGCMVTLGTDFSLDPFGFGAGSRNSNMGAGDGQRLQVHMYEYPLFAIMGGGFDVGCASTAGIPGLRSMALSELDPVWQNDQLAVFQSPEIALFSNPIAQASCAIDSVAATVSHSLDYMFWCQGAWGPSMPFSGNPNTMVSDQQVNAHTAFKFVAQQARRQIIWTTIGSSAECSAHPSQIVKKSQFRWDQISPIAYQGDVVTTGESEVTWGYTGGGGGPTNRPLRQDSGYLLWQGRQCCARP